MGSSRNVTRYITLGLVTRVVIIFVGTVAAVGEAPIAVVNHVAFVCDDHHRIILRSECPDQRVHIVLNPTRQRAVPASSYSARAPASGHARAPPPARAPVASTAGCRPAHPPPAPRPASAASARPTPSSAPLHRPAPPQTCAPAVACARRLRIPARSPPAAAGCPAPTGSGSPLRVASACGRAPRFGRLRVPAGSPPAHPHAGLSTSCAGSGGRPVPQPGRRLPRLARPPAGSPLDPARRLCLRWLLPRPHPGRLRARRLPVGSCRPDDSTTCTGLQAARAVSSGPSASMRPPPESPRGGSPSLLYVRARWRRPPRRLQRRSARRLAARSGCNLASPGRRLHPGRAPSPALRLPAPARPAACRLSPLGRPSACRLQRARPPAGSRHSAGPPPAGSSATGRLPASRVPAGSPTRPLW
nr:translation initiation factor IF-2-like [Aegilops tauschii subsp. strangulata]